MTSYFFISYPSHVRAVESFIRLVVVGFINLSVEAYRNGEALRQQLYDGYTHSMKRQEENTPLLNAFVPFGLLPPAPPSVTPLVTPAVLPSSNDVLITPVSFDLKRAICDKKMNHLRFIKLARECGYNGYAKKRCDILDSMTQSELELLLSRM